MTAYVIVDIVRIRDEATYAAYRCNVSPTLRAAGGHYLVRGGNPVLLHGQWHPHRLVLVSFATISAAVGWWSSPEYATLRDARQRSTDSNMVAVEGCGSPREAPGSNPKACIILDFRAVSDESGFATVREQASLSLKRHRGVYLVFDGHAEVLEGNWQPGRLDVLAFGCQADARSWWSAPEQAALLQYLQAPMSFNVVLAECLMEGTAI